MHKGRRWQVIAAAGVVLALLAWAIGDFVLTDSNKSRPGTAVFPLAPGAQRLSNDSTPDLPVATESATTGDLLLTGELSILVLDEFDRPVAGAEVIDPGDSTILATTDIEGSASCAMDPEAVGGLLVSARAFVPQEIDSLEVSRALGLAEILEVRLRRGLRLGGHVVVAGGGPPSAGTPVVAWPAQFPPSETSLRLALAAARAMARDPMAFDGLPGDVSQGEVPVQPAAAAGPVVTLTDSFGAFEFPEVIHEGLYSLTAGGPGYVARRRVVVRAEWQQPVEIKLLNHYSLAIQMTDETGAPVSIPEHTPMGAHPTIAIRSDADWDFGTHGWMERVLLDIGLLEARRSGQWVLELVSNSALESVGPVHFNAIAPGYNKNSTQLAIPNTKHGLAHATVPLVSASVATGALDVVLDGWTEATQDLNPIEDLLMKLLLIEDGTAHVETFYLTDFPEDHALLEGVPLGTYKVQLYLSGPFGYLESPEPVVIGAEPGRIQFDLTQFGSLAIDLTDELGLGFTGKAELILQRVDYPAGQMFVFEAPPYRVAFLKPGSYFAILSRAWDGTKGRQITGRSAPAEVRSGECVVATLEFFQDG